MRAVNKSEIKEIYMGNPSAKVVLDALNNYQKNVKETKLGNLHTELEGKVSYKDILTVAKQLSAVGVGNLVVGRRGSPTRIVWNVPVTNLGKYAQGQIEDLESEPCTKMLEHSFPVRPDMNFKAVLPSDLTQSEANRLADFIRTLPFTS